MKIPDLDADRARYPESAWVREQSLWSVGHGWCGNGDPCPLHETIAGMLAGNLAFLEKTSLAVFKEKPSGKPARRIPGKRSRSSRRPGVR